MRYNPYIEDIETNVDESREIEKLNNRFAQKIEEIERLKEQIKTNIHNLGVLAVKSASEGYIVNVNEFTSIYQDERLLDMIENYDGIIKITVSKKETTNGN